MPSSRLWARNSSGFAIESKRFARWKWNEWTRCRCIAWPAHYCFYFFFFFFFSFFFCRSGSRFHFMSLWPFSFWISSSFFLFHLNFFVVNFAVVPPVSGWNSCSCIMGPSIRLQFIASLDRREGGRKRGWGGGWGLLSRCLNVLVFAV